MPEPITAEKIQSWLATSPFVVFLGLVVESLDSERSTITIRMPMRAEFERFPGTGQYHGGAVAALIDTVGDFAVAMFAGGAVPTMNFRVDYLRPSAGGDLVGKAVVRRLGRTVAVVDIDVFDTQNRLTAVGRGTYGVQMG